MRDKIRTGLVALCLVLLGANLAPVLKLDRLPQPLLDIAYAADIFQPLPASYETNMAAGSGTTITQNLSTAKSAYTQLIASTAKAATVIQGNLLPLNGDAVAESVEIFIATGGAGSESDKVFVGCQIQSTTYRTICPFTAPLTIPASTRISAAIQFNDSRATQSVNFFIAVGEP